MITVDLNKFQWSGVMSIWGQGEDFWQGICYSGLNRSPRTYIKEIGKDAPPVVLLFPRFVPLTMAQNWLSYLSDNVIPEEVQEHVKITRVKTKDDWPTKWKYQLQRDDVIQRDWGVEDDDDIDDVKYSGKHFGLTPWLRVELGQELSNDDMFTLANLIRYVSEHGRIIKLREIVSEWFPKLPAYAHLTIAQHMLGTCGHAVGMVHTIYEKEAKNAVEKFDWRKCWLKMRENNPPFHVRPEKEGQIDSWFAIKSSVRNGPYFCKDYDVAGRVLEFGGYQLRMAHNNPLKFLSLFKEYT